MTRYIEISDDIRNKIVASFYQQGQQLPKQMELMEEYQTSRMTIQKALNLLNMEGLITAKKGTGTFVSKKIPPQFFLDSKVNQFTGVTDHLRGKGRLSSEVISFDVRFPDEVEVEKLQIADEDPVYDIIRLRKLDKEPILLEYTIMPLKVIPNITKKILNQSIYYYIQHELTLSIGSAVRRIHADRPDAYDKQYLECKEIDPVLEINQVAYLSDGRPFEYSQTRHRYDKGDIIFSSPIF
ncbi:GntR family transcriptional regulator [Enterococcus hulanensis]|uniref:GntR family transcriptional regulator n=1 Tax=Enterococcus hulanensis TaxID=2559929 RepID=UPI001A8F6079|nr:GntR family transcriptional regulator [Enterococcus hulanensis]MBO0455387.1 GntR family transcriptional regulator [Enterococcus hulanensis]